MTLATPDGDEILCGAWRATEPGSQADACFRALKLAHIPGQQQAAADTARTYIIGRTSRSASVVPEYLWLMAGLQSRYSSMQISGYRLGSGGPNILPVDMVIYFQSTAP